MKLILTAIATASLACLSQGAVIVNGGWLNTTAATIYPVADSWGDPEVNDPANFLSTTTTASHLGVVNNTTYDFGIPGSSGHIQASFDYSVDAVEGQYGEPHNQGEVYFTVTDDPVLYFLSGDLILTGPGDISTYAVLGAGKSVLFNNQQSSTNTPNDTLTLGEAAGDHTNFLAGSLTGLLGPGSYTLSYGSTLQSKLGASAAAKGFVRLEFVSTVPEAVPEPSTWAFMGIGMGLLGLLAARRKS